MNETTIILEELKKILDLISELNEKFAVMQYDLVLELRKLAKKLEFITNDEKEPGIFDNAPADEYLDQLEAEEHSKLYPSTIAQY